MIKNYGKKIKFIRKSILVLFLVLIVGITAFGISAPYSDQAILNPESDVVKNIVNKISIFVMVGSLVLIIVSVIVGLVLNYLPVVNKKDLQLFLTENYSHPFTKKELKFLSSFNSSSTRKSGRTYVSKASPVSGVRGKLPHTINPMLLLQEGSSDQPYLVTVDFKNELQLVPTIQDELDYDFIKTLFNRGAISLLGLRDLDESDESENWAKQILVDYSNPMETTQKNTRVWLSHHEFNKYYESVEDQFSHIMIHKIYSLLDILVALDTAEHTVTFIDNGEEITKVPADMINTVMKIKMF